jgi:hypothetical protein
VVFTRKKKGENREAFFFNRKEDKKREKKVKLKNSTEEILTAPFRK